MFLKIFSNSTGKHLWHQHRCFPVKFAKFLRTSGLNCNLQLFQKETPIQVFSNEIYEVFKSTYFGRTSVNNSFWQFLTLSNKALPPELSHHNLVNCLRCTLDPIKESENLWLTLCLVKRFDWTLLKINRIILKFTKFTKFLFLTKFQFSSQHSCFAKFEFW